MNVNISVVLELICFVPNKGGRKILKAAALTMFAYCSLLLYRNGLPCLTHPSQEVVTSTASIPDSITLDDIFISVKTTSKNENTRLPIILKTWFQLAKEQTWFFTDRENKTLQAYTNGHMVNTGCKPSHLPYDLCCKMNVELDFYLASDKKWFCHFDDDNFVNVPKLVEVLRKYDYKQNWYLGKNSVANRTVAKLRIQNRIQNATFPSVKFRFATGGAGMCISASLALKIAPYIRNGGFVVLCRITCLTDDLTLGFIIEYYVKKSLTVVSEFHSHLEKFSALDIAIYQNQISFSYDLPSKVVRMPEGVALQNDTTGFLALHCLLFPQLDADFCKKV